MADMSIAQRDGAAPTLHGSLVRVVSARFVENGAGTYVKDVFLPKYAVLLDVIVTAEALWTAATSAALVVGDYADSSGAIGSAIDADGIYASTNLKATDLLAGESLSFAKTGGKEGAYLTGTATSWDKRQSASDRWLRASITSVGAGTAGRTTVSFVYAVPELDEVTQ